MSDERPRSILADVLKLTTRTPAQRAQYEADVRAHFESFADRWRVRFERTRDPFDLWAGYHASRALGVPIPPWILAEFDVIAHRLIPHSAHPGALDRLETRRPWAIRIAEAFGFQANERGGRNDPFKRWQLRSRDLRLAYAVYALISDGHKETNAVAMVATQEHPPLSEKTVREAWQEFETLVRILEQHAGPRGAFGD